MLCFLSFGSGRSVHVLLAELDMHIFLGIIGKREIAYNAGRY